MKESDRKIVKVGGGRGPGVYRVFSTYESRGFLGIGRRRRKGSQQFHAWTRKSAERKATGIRAVFRRLGASRVR